MAEEVKEGLGSVPVALEGRPDQFGGVIVSASTVLAWCQTAAAKAQQQAGTILLPALLPGEFDRSLAAALQRWRETGVRGVWVSLPKLDQEPVRDKSPTYGDAERIVAKPVDSSTAGSFLLSPSESGRLVGAFVGSLLASGFRFHHAEGTDDIVLITWLPTEEPDQLPLATTHYCGVGGFVVREPAVENVKSLSEAELLEQTRILSITEARGPFSDFFKMPGGRVDPHEELYEAVVREVLEETSVVCEPESLLAFRQASGPFGFPDLYFVFKLRPRGVVKPDWKAAHSGDALSAAAAALSSGQLLPLDELRPQEEEIGECKWMSAREFFELPHYSTGVYARLNKTLRDHILGKYPGVSVEKLPIGFRPGENVLYHACDLDHDSPNQYPAEFAQVSWAESKM